MREWSYAFRFQISRSIAVTAPLVQNSGDVLSKKTTPSRSWLVKKRSSLVRSPMDLSARSSKPILVPMTQQKIDFIEELEWRGLLHQCTDEDGLRKYLADPERAPRKVYAGFDPTADSLTIGNLVPIMLLAHVKRAGHVPVVLMGGGTGLIGDPSGKSAERSLITDQTVEANVHAQQPIFEIVLGCVEGPKHCVVNNVDWLGGLGYIEVLRNIGKHFSVNMMMQKESVKERLHNREQGISYTEFSYMILQAYDFWKLFYDDQVAVQVGGSDQYGNIIAGIDLIRRISFDLIKSVPMLAAEAQAAAAAGQIELAASLAKQAAMYAASPEPESFGLTAPLVTKSDGSKFGKTETGAIWLTRERTSPYAYYQFWLNASDDDVIKFLKIFTLLTKDEVDELERGHVDNPGAREAHKKLAQCATAIIHGKKEAEQAENASKALFSGDIVSLPKALLEDVFANIPSSDHSKADLENQSVDLVELLVETKLAQSKRQAREFLANGSVSINGSKITPETKLALEHLLHDEIIAIRRGKKAWHLTRWN